MSALIEAIYAHKQRADRERGVLMWPSTKYERDPVGFCMDILGFAPTAFQAECLTAIVTQDKIVVRSGRKKGKSRAQAAAALWHYCLYRDSAAVLLAPTLEQIHRVVWHDLQGLHAGAGRCVACKQRDPGGPRPCPHSACVDGALSPSCVAGVQVGQRRIWGMAPRNSENTRGPSGARMLYILDEAPGVDEEIFDACCGNIAATGRTIVAFGNPSQRSGWFFDAHTKPGKYHRIAGSSLDSPNLRLDGCKVEGLAGENWIAQMREELAEDDPRWMVDVLGEFPTREMQRVIDDRALSRMFARAEVPEEGDGELYFGIDCAGGIGRDTSVITCRRGYRFEPLLGFQGATDRIMMELEGLLKQHRRGKETVWVNYDSAGAFGKDLGAALGQLRKRDDQIIARGLDGRGDVSKMPALALSGYSRPRDCYWGNAAQLLKRVVSIPYHDGLAQDLTFAEWDKDPKGRDRLKDAKKTEQRKATGRSPDFGDAVAYCLWEGRVVPLSEIVTEIRETEIADDEREEADAKAVERPHVPAGDVYEDPPEQTFDPYEGAFGGKAWRQR